MLAKVSCCLCQAWDHLVGATKPSTIGRCLCWAWSCVEEATLWPEACCHQCWAWAYSPRGTGNTQTTFSLPGACGPLRVFRKFCLRKQGLLTVRHSCWKNLEWCASCMGQFSGSYQGQASGLQVNADSYWVPACMCGLYEGRVQHMHKGSCCYRGVRLEGDSC